MDPSCGIYETHRTLLLDEYSNRIINIHPSLLPKYPGLNAFERAFADKSSSGITLHLVDQGLDTGPVIKQKSFPFFKEDTLSDFIQRGKQVEWELYPEVLKLLNESTDLLRENNSMGETMLTLSTDKQSLHQIFWLVHEVPRVD